MQVPTDQAFEGEIVLADALPAAAYLPIKSGLPTATAGTT
jgi:hypothetical protein